MKKLWNWIKNLFKKKKKEDYIAINDEDILMINDKDKFII